MEFLALASSLKSRCPQRGKTEQSGYFYMIAFRSPLVNCYQVDVNDVSLYFIATQLRKKAKRAYLKLNLRRNNTAACVELTINNPI